MPLDEEMRREIVDSIVSGRKIAAIKIYREATGSGLKEAKEFVDALADRLREEQPSLLPPKSSGCGAASIAFLCVVGLVFWWVA